MSRFLLLFAVSFMLTGITARSQVVIIFGGKVPGYLSNYEIGYSYSFTAVNQVQTFTLPDGSVHEFKSNQVRSLMSPGVYIGWSLALKKLGMQKRSALGLNIGMQENMFLWSHTSKTWGKTSWAIDGTGQDGFYDEETIGMSMQIGVPVSLDFKFGFDALKYKNIRWASSVGIGVMPQFTMSAGIPNFESESFAIGVTPFIKGDIGFFAGIAMKLRAQVGFGVMPMADSRNSMFGGMSGGIFGENSGVKHEYKVNAPVQATISFIIMPFSWTWGEKGWWNTYR